MESCRGGDQYAVRAATAGQFHQQEAGLDGFAQTDIIRDQQAYARLAHADENWH